MTKCSQKNCDKDATVQYEHSGKIVFGCDEHWHAYQQIMDAMGQPKPIGYDVGTKTL